MRTLILVISVFLATQPATPQARIQTKPGFSESIVYVPRVLPTPAPKRKKHEKSVDKAASDQTAAPARDSEIRLPVSVLAGDGKPVADVDASEFSVYVNGDIVPLRTAARNSDPVTIFFLIDTSPSAAYDIKDLRKRVSEMLDAFRPQDVIQLVTFNEGYRLVGEPTDDHAALKRSIGRIDMGDGTSLYEVVRGVFQKEVPRVSGDKVVVVFTDGVDTTSRSASYTSSLLAAEQAAVPVFVIYQDTSQRALSGKGVAARGGAANISSDAILDMLRRAGMRPASPQDIRRDYDTGLLYLNDIVFLSGGRALQDTGSQSVAGAIAEQLYHRYVITFDIPEGLNAGQRLSIRVRVNRPGLAVMARGSYIVK